MNVVRAFANYLEDAGVATLGTDLFISRAPSSLTTGNRIFWLKATGGGEVSRAITGSAERQYVIEVYHRDTSTEGVYETMQQLGDDLVCAGCLTLEGYDVEDVRTNGPFADQDLDNEERTVALLQVTVSVRNTCSDILIS